MVRKALVSAQKPRRRQLNAKVCVCKIAIFRILSFFGQPKYLKNGLSTHRGFSTIMIYTSTCSTATCDVNKRKKELGILSIYCFVGKQGLT